MCATQLGCSLDLKVTVSFVLRFHNRPRLIHALRQSSKHWLVKYQFDFPPSDPDVVASLYVEHHIQAAKA